MTLTSCNLNVLLLNFDVINVTAKPFSVDSTDRVRTKKEADDADHYNEHGDFS